jgi:diadenosine tetraphosphate (Ap4A) HIT family hydrolase
LLPKHDVKSIGALTAEDQASVMGCFALVSKLASESRAQNYRLVTNGPALQHVTYLHFHFLAQ